MSLSATLYTLAAIGFFALMVNRPPVEIPSITEANQPAANTEVSETMATADTVTTTSTRSSSELNTANEPTQDSTSPTSQPSSTTAPRN